jgi:hypothetical protein
LVSKKKISTHENLIVKQQPKARGQAVGKEGKRAGDISQFQTIKRRENMLKLRFFLNEPNGKT